ncbi:hypothetical protein Mapa_007738 [Marchantia paleacea]|nr:hypothetical protein Mapa_007738 [Marchantia paleacea]
MPMPKPKENGSWGRIVSGKDKGWVRAKIKGPSLSGLNFVFKTKKGPWLQVVNYEGRSSSLKQKQGLSQNACPNI